VRAIQNWRRRHSAVIPESLHKLRDSAQESARVITALRSLMTRASSGRILKRAAVTEARASRRQARTSHSVCPKLQPGNARFASADQIRISEAAMSVAARADASLCPYRANRLRLPIQHSVLRRAAETAIDPLRTHEPRAFVSRKRSHFPPHLRSRLFRENTRDSA
jgi:hypothetical protein